MDILCNCKLHCLDNTRSALLHGIAATDSQFHNPRGTWIDLLRRDNPALAPRNLRVDGPSVFSFQGRRSPEQTRFTNARNLLGIVKENLIRDPPRPVE